MFFAACPDPAALLAWTERLPPAAKELLAAAYGFFTPAQAARPAGEPAAGWEKARVLRHVREYGYYANCKIGLQYAVEQGFDGVIFVGRGAEFTPEALQPLLEAAVFDGAAIAVGLASDTPPPSAAERRAIRLTNWILHRSWRELRSGWRYYSTAALRAIPFLLNTENEAFDAQLLIQGRALDLSATEVPLPGARVDRPALGDREAWRLFSPALHYRLHQLHLLRHGRWLVDFGERYTYKRSPFGSHQQILAAVPAGSRVLDLGCSQGLLADRLVKAGCHVAGVDQLPPERVRLPYDQYRQADLDDPALRLPYGREFDVVILADVIEHLKNREAVLALARRHLKPEGRMIISTGNIAIWFYRLSLLLGRFEYDARGILDDTHVRLFTRATFTRLLRQAGFEIVRVAVTTLPFEIIFQSHAENPLVRFLDRAYHRLARFWPELFAYQFVLEARIARLEHGESTAWPEAAGR
ncbi:MAG: methyltransferase domain-containing protein [Myxococcales bacterium]|nr:methyltransferase domain-containing protein [Myxococcales bacterium]